MPAVIRAIGTAVPDHTVMQDRIRDRFLGQPGLNRLGARLVRAAFDGADIDERGTVLADLSDGRRPFAEPAEDSALMQDALGELGGQHERGGQPEQGEPAFIGHDGAILSPSTGYRNDRYRDLAPDLFVGAARAAVERADIAPESITHVVTVSCTGFTQPGPDLDVVRRLGLGAGVFRHHIGFMGCAAAFPALRMAAAFCEADPDAVVLVVCAELCTLHVRASDRPDQIVANAVFADGAAAAIVSADLPERFDDEAGRADAAPGLRLDQFATTAIDDGAKDMAWNIGDAGFEMVLSPRVPKLVQEHVREAVEPILTARHSGVTDVAHWAVHPGGRAILDRVEEELGLGSSALTASRAVLRRHGNMSSATILFVLDAILRDGPEVGAAVAALAFGPGLTVETAGLTVVR